MIYGESEDEVMRLTGMEYNKRVGAVDYDTWFDDTSGMWVGTVVTDGVEAAHVE
jgi:hypothetical protein